MFNHFFTYKYLDKLYCQFRRQISAHCMDTYYLLKFYMIWVDLCMKCSYPLKSHTANKFNYRLKVNVRIRQPLNLRKQVGWLPSSYYLSLHGQALPIWDRNVVNGLGQVKQFVDDVSQVVQFYEHAKVILMLL